MELNANWYLCIKYSDHVFNPVYFTVIFKTSECHICHTFRHKQVSYHIKFIIKLELDEYLRKVQ